MSRRSPHQLTVRQVAALKEGAQADGGNLWVVAKGGSKVWTFRYTSPKTGKRREMGLGSAVNVSLVEARKRAADCRHALLVGVDPLEQRRAEEAAAKREQGLTFQQVAERYITEQSPGWRDMRAAATWTASLELNAFPVCGATPVEAMGTDAVLEVLRPIWATKTETASRIRGRIERILDYARTHGWRSGENPARWKGHLAAILPKPTAVAKIEHHAAVDRKGISRVMAALAMSSGVAAKAVRFACLTAARSGEVRAAVWSEIDLTEGTWAVPAHKMKAGKEHRVPLTNGALAILREVEPLRDPRAGDLVFPGQKRGKPLSDVALSKALHLAAGTKDVTVHGLRSTFRDWAAEETDYPREVAEMALAHAIGDKVEAAYRRGDLFEKRRQMMDDWARWVASSTRN
ncbi:bacteriophage P4 integrase [Gluconacetobacter liquefaciens]|uniref:Integrase n=1 Tax=Gluconacetobacter liquefaciens TaxID=89584 RepID=A0A370G7W7_GLULI|nr:integrase arm-type DNA-binding domain-containing protein [Gluconacetobacter liquefaciens]MBB2186459.1 tyrosine-type recombinase/integrase [Gluconacetobacter liquefaciens]RDI38123.1 integrase [Gluconacetobacter liquefaciens]GBQ94594.1 phage integrase [Gluconacetobacter liquefaciens NRIC 0522]GEB38340.1 bacteriophage P4 integrase [Gluconacetobacter liquefaciens]